MPSLRVLATAVAAACYATAQTTGVDAASTTFVDTTSTVPYPLSYGASYPGMLPHYVTFSWISDGSWIVASVTDFYYPPSSTDASVTADAIASSAATVASAPASITGPSMVTVTSVSYVGAAMPTTFSTSAVPAASSADASTSSSSVLPDTTCSTASVMASSSISAAAASTLSTSRASSQTSVTTTSVPSATTVPTISTPESSSSTFPVPSATTVQTSQVSSVQASQATSISTSQATSVQASQATTVQASQATTTDQQTSTTAAAPSAVPHSVSCPEIGPGLIGTFTLTFDDHVPGPIFNPYNALYFSNGWSFVKPSFQTITSPNVALFEPNASTTDIGSPDAADLLPGEISPGPEPSNNAFWFNTVSLWITCENPTEEFCMITYTMMSWDADTQTTRKVEGGGSAIPPCPSNGCGLFPNTEAIEGNNLTSFQIQATVNGQPVPFYVDSFTMSWSNNSCEAALERAHIH